MPTISTFAGVVVRMHYVDHPPPHVHAFHQGHEALVSIETGRVIQVVLPPATALLMRRLVLARQKQLQENWGRRTNNLPLSVVKGPDW